MNPQRKPLSAWRQAALDRAPRAPRRAGVSTPPAACPALARTGRADTPRVPASAPLPRRLALEHRLYALFAD